MDAMDISTAPRIRGAKLDTLGAVKSELGKIYREARRGELDAQKATRLASILLNIAQLMKAEEPENGSKRGRKGLETVENDPE